MTCCNVSQCKSESRYIVSLITLIKLLQHMKIQGAIRNIGRGKKLESIYIQQHSACSEVELIVLVLLPYCILLSNQTHLQWQPL